MNPVFIVPNKIWARGAEIAKAYAASLTMGAEHFCTKPGLIVLREGTERDAYLSAALSALRDAAAQTLLTKYITKGFVDRQRTVPLC